MLLSSDRNFKDLHRLYNHTESHIHSLKSLRIESASYGALLAPVLLSKLPPELRLIVSRKVSDSNLDMDALLATFEKELTARERANSQSSRHGQERVQPTVSTLFSSSQNVKPNPQCCYCLQSHPSTSCTCVTSPADRKQIHKTNGQCFNCLRRNHTSICDANLSRPSSSSHSVQSGLAPDASLVQATQTTSTLCSHNQQVILLQTAKAVVHQPHDPHVSLEVRLILDGGSQRSYITERTQRLLNLKASKEQSLSIATFGSNEGSTRVCPVVDISLCLRGYPSMLLSVYVVPTICEPLVRQSVSACANQFPHLLGLELADVQSTGLSMSVDMLVGSDYYWELVTGSICRGVSGPVAIHTKLGWVLSGPSSHEDPGQCAMNLNVTHVLHVDSCQMEPQTLEEQLRAFWELEALGIPDKEKTLYDTFTKAVKFENGRYKVPLPWREFHDSLPDNYQLSLNRLQGLLRRLKQDPAVLKEYTASGK